MDIVWTNTIDDDAYTATVFRTGERTGTLTVTRADGFVVLTEDVTLAYGAVFGPDVADISTWCDMTVRAVDGDYASRTRDDAAANGDSGQ